jgi:excisionase family DNA binding protein
MRGDTMTSTPSAGPASPDAIYPLVVRPREACRLLAVGNTRLYQLIGNGELETYLDGRSRRITIGSIRAYIARRLTSTASTRSGPLRARRRGRPRKQHSLAGETSIVG